MRHFTPSSHDNYSGLGNAYELERMNLRSRRPDFIGIPNATFWNAVRFADLR